METVNDFLVGSSYPDIVIMRFAQRMTQEQAIRLAAWLVAICNTDHQKTFAPTLEAILNS